MKQRTLGPGPWCGTAGGYGNHKCRCEPCTEANSKAVGARRVIRYAERQLVDGELVHPRLRRHGTVTGYQYWGCRCPKCRRACANGRQVPPKRQTKRRRPEFIYVCGPTGWNVYQRGNRKSPEPKLLGRVQVESFDTGKWGAWHVLEGGKRGEQVASGLPGRDAAAEALWEALGAGKAVKR